jgi:hypothetical protein
MTNQHRATADLWDRITDPDGPASWSCLLELRARVEALEAQHETQRLATLEWGKDVDQLQRWADVHLKRIMALESTQHAHASTSHLSDEERRAAVEGLSKPGRWQPLRTEVTYGEAHAHAQALVRHLSMDQAGASAAPAPTGSLVERVEARAGGDARAAIREVAAWLDEWNESVIQEARDSQPIPDPCGPSDDLTAGEAIDRLRDEANR